MVFSLGKIFSQKFVGAQSQRVTFLFPIHKYSTGYKIVRYIVTYIAIYDMNYGFI